MIPNSLWIWNRSATVVNCFQNCIFTYDSQLAIVSKTVPTRCELLSELYFYLWFPTHTNHTFRNTVLWIAFRIVFLLMIPNYDVPPVETPEVVNCFQNCIFTYDSQQVVWWIDHKESCELLSELYFYLWFPTFSLKRVSPNPLWIAFRIVFLLMIPNKHQIREYKKSVVNCFQNCIFTYDSQLTVSKVWRGICCELLSELYFYLWFPTDDKPPNW